MHLMGMIVVITANCVHKVFVSLSNISVEENVGNVVLELRRSTPSFDDITVTIETITDNVNDTNMTGDYIPM